MSLKNKLNQKGFTIVELLIVIVVIAILAAISIGLYVGIQQRARDTARKSDVNSIAKAIGGLSAEETFTWASIDTAAEAAAVLAAPTTVVKVPATVIAKIVASPVPSASETVNYQYLPCPAAPATATGVKISYWQEQGAGSVQTVNIGDGC